ncbi:MAG: glycosyltransferase family 25 protein [Candidatus Pacearchaeota archaeon]
MKIDGFGKIYIIHHAPLKERGDYLRKRIKELGIEDIVTFDVTYEKKPLTKREYSYYDFSEEAWKDRLTVIGKILKNTNHPLKENEIRVCLRHIKILKKIASKKDSNVYMIMEDDVLINNDFVNRLKELIKQLKNVKWDICYVGKGGMFIEPKATNGNLYIPKNKSSNGASSYLLTPTSARKFLKYMKKFALAIDGEYGYIQKKYNFNVYWGVPFLTREGSVEGFYRSDVRKSSLTQKANLFLNKIRNINPKLANFFAYLFYYILKIKNKILYNHE